LTENAIHRILEREQIPKMAKVRQYFPSEKIGDVPLAVKKALHRPEIMAKIRPGMSVAVTAGSRGISNMPLILAETVAFVREMGGNPFLIPAMGSHGGAAAVGQARILADYGITEDTIGAPIRATMETKQIGVLPDGTPVFIDKYAAEADGIIVVNRIKPHTGFRGKYESGLFKMMAIGLGKQYGAEKVHGRGAKEMGESIELFGRAILTGSNILFGLATIENAFDRTHTVVSLTPSEIIEKEPEYLALAKSLMAKIYFDRLDLVIVDYFGKNISGGGVDPNITFTYKQTSGISCAQKARQVIVLDLTEESCGNAHGVGVLDIITRRFFDKIDLTKTYVNSLTTGGTEVPRIPMIMDNQKLAIKAGIKCAVGADKDRLRVVRIRDTMHLDEIYISEALMLEARSNPSVEVLEEPQSLVFNESGDLF